MALSDLTIRQAKAKAKAKAKATGSHFTINDIDGLSLAVSGVGGKSWHFRYYSADKQKRMSLGSYPEVSLRVARALHDGAPLRETQPSHLPIPPSAGCDWCAEVKER